jgi:hypothetical protein
MLLLCGGNMQVCDWREKESISQRHEFDLEGSERNKTAHTVTLDHDRHRDPRPSLTTLRRRQAFYFQATQMKSLSEDHRTGPRTFPRFAARLKTAPVIGLLRQSGSTAEPANRLAPARARRDGGRISDADARLASRPPQTSPTPRSHSTRDAAVRREITSFSHFFASLFAPSAASKPSNQINTLNLHRQKIFTRGKTRKSNVNLCRTEIDFDLRPPSSVNFFNSQNF